MAPDTIPADLYERADFVNMGGGGRISTSTLMVSFVPSATQAERQAAVDSIHGVVIGGARAGKDGMYLVRVPGDGTLATIHAIGESFALLPAVASCAPFWAGGIGPA